MNLTLLMKNNKMDGGWKKFQPLNFKLRHIIIKIKGEKYEEFK